MVLFVGLAVAPSDALAFVIGGKTYCPGFGFSEFSNEPAQIGCPQPENPSEYDLQGLLQNLETPYTGQGKPLDVDEATDD